MQIFPLKIFPNNSNFDFMRMKNLNYALSVFLFFLSIAWIGVYKFNFGIDFIGGISMELRVDQTPDLPKMRTVLGNLEIGEIVLQNFGSDKDISIRAGISSEENLMHNIDLIKSALTKNFPYKIEYRKVDFVGPQIGNQMIQSGITALLLSFIFIMIYIWIRFEWQFALGVLAALVHDAVLSLGFLSATKLDFNLSTIAAILTIIGYSVNDTVVIYDRIRENLRKYNKKPIGTIINMSVNETLSRTTITVFTTLLANLALILYGGEAIKSFSVLVFFGILIGTYSSIFISAPVITLFNFKNLKEWYFMRISANDIKSGNILDYEGELWIVSKTPEHTKPGKGGAYVQVEMKNLRTGNKLNQRFSSSESVEKAFLERKEMQYLYKEENLLVFMDPNSFEQVMIDQDLMKDKLPFLTDGMNVEVEFYQDKPLSVVLTQTVILEIQETDPVIKGSTVTSSYKPAIMTNGLRVMVPPYLVTGEKIIVRTEDATFVKRAE